MSKLHLTTALYHSLYIWVAEEIRTYFLVTYKMINKQIFRTNVDTEKTCQWKKLLERANESVRYKDLEKLEVQENLSYSVIFWATFSVLLML